MNQQKTIAVLCLGLFMAVAHSPTIIDSKTQQIQCFAVPDIISVFCSVCLEKRIRVEYMEARCIKSDLRQKKAIHTSASEYEPHSFHETIDVARIDLESNRYLDDVEACDAHSQKSK